MRPPIRVLIANDSAVIRRLVTEALTEAEGFEVHPAVHGRDAMNQLSTARPDVLILDTEMPVMNGIQTVRAVRQENLNLPIIMLCHSSEASSRAMADAIPAGANDCAKFSVRMGHVESAKALLRQELIPKIRYWVNLRLEQMLQEAIQVPVGQPASDGPEVRRPLEPFRRPWESGSENRLR